MNQDSSRPCSTVSKRSSLTFLLLTISAVSTLLDAILAQSSCPTTHFFSQSSQTCELCHYTCRQCSSSGILGCTACESGATLAAGKCECTSTNSFMDTTTGVCTRCFSTCSACFGGGEDECFNCFQGANFVQTGTTASGISRGKCVAADGWYINDAGQKSQCHPTCKSCLSSNLNGCLTCLSPAILVVESSYGNGRCICPDSYYFASSGCQHCHLSCSTCSGPLLSDCLSCKANAVLSAVGDCVCATGYLMIYTGDCVIVNNCHSTCLTCSMNNAETACLTCKPNMVLSESNRCSPIDGYYFDTTTQTAKPCHPSCATCLVSGEEGCTSCNITNTQLLTYSVTGRGACACSHGSYLDLNSSPQPQCTPISTSCRSTTFNSPTSCTACSGFSVLIFAQCRCSTSSLSLPDCDKVADPCSSLFLCYACGTGTIYEDGPTGMVAVTKLLCTNCGSYSQIVNGICVCIDGFYPSGNQCLPCHPTCQKCSSLTNCLQCKSIQMTYKNDGTCSCPAKGAYLDPKSYICYPCYVSCETCTGPQSDQCLTCAVKSATPSLGKCSTSTTYNTPCHNTCASCFGPSNEECMACKTQAYPTPPAYKARLGTCMCQHGYYMDQTTGICMPCDSTCYTCKGPYSTDCLSCRNTYIFGLDGTCTCPPGSIEHFQQKICATPHFSCEHNILWTVDPEACVRCKSNAQLIPGPISHGTYGPYGSCRCNTGYYMDHKGDCQLCHPTCLTCSAPGIFGCDTVNVPMQLHPNAYMALCPSSSSSSFTDLTTGLCTACDPSCLTCYDGNANSCLSCRSDFYLSSGTCICKPGFTLSGTACLPCHPYCSECNVPNDQNQCKNVLRDREAFSSGTTICSMPGYLQTGFARATDGTCYLNTCHISCKTCAGPTQSGCLTCPAGSELTPLSGPTGKCICSAGFGLNSAATRCVPCDPKCSTCDPSNFQSCLACRALPASLSAGAPTCSCATAYYFEYPSGLCQQCHSTCRSCNGPTFRDCLTCPATNTLSQGVCGPPSSKYLTNTYDVSACTGLCTTCKSSFDYCISCYTGTSSATLITRATCDCIGSTYRDSPTTCGSVTCNPQCNPPYCTGQGGSFCISCRNGDNANINGKCICWELSKGEIMGTPGLCGLCHPTCLTCSWANDPTKCTSCGVGVIITGIEGECLCPLDMEIGSNNFCVGKSPILNCDARCNTCAAPAYNQCTSCRSDSSLSGSSCYCTSSTVYMDSFGKCRPCHPTCKTCLNGTPTGCLTCSDPNTVLLSNGTCIKNWINGCHPTCLTCIGPSANQCTSCNTGASFKAPSVPNFCICSTSTQYLSSDGTCLSCNPSCDQCSGPLDTECTVCKQKFILSPNGQCRCNQNQINTALQCVGFVCHVTCSYCKDNTVNGCTTCKTGLILSLSTSCECPTGFYMNKLEWNCYSCHSTCLSCTGPLPTDCTICKSPPLLSYLHNCQCPANSIVDSTYYTCSAIICPNYCLRCFSPSKCAVCQPNFYLTSDFTCQCPSNRYLTKDGQCLLCDASCDSCSGPGPSLCLSCKAYTALVQSLCVCRMGYYRDPVSTNCVPCHQSCLACDGGTDSNCKVCHKGGQLSSGRCVAANSTIQLQPSTGNFLQPNAPAACQVYDTPTQACLGCREHATYLQSATQCICQPGFKINTLGDCVVASCYKRCSTCVGPSLYECTSCHKLTLLDTSASLPLSGECFCGRGYGFDDNEQCKPCHPTCLTCTTTKTNGCKECRRPDMIYMPDQSCSCPVGYYFSLSTNMCEMCDHRCETCSGPNFTDCITCHPYSIPFVHPNNSLECRCSSDQILHPSGHCSLASCDSTCKLCATSDPSRCTLCGINHFLASNNTCLCRSGALIEPDSSCPDSSCPSTCALCESPSSPKCKLCFAGAFLTQDKKCQCKEGTYFDSLNLTCPSCHFSCRSCTGPASNQCTSCLGQGVQFISNTCECTSGLLMNSLGYCTNCPLYCKQCNSRYGCLSCWENAILTTEETCLCGSGYYRTRSGGCQLCHSDCQECTGPSISECLPCKGDLKLRGLECVCTTLGTYRMGYSCLPCNTSLGCMTCDSSTSCSSCLEGYKFIKTQKRCKRIPMYKPFEYSISVLHHQLFLSISLDESRSTPQERINYMASIAKNNLLIIVREEDADTDVELPPCNMSWVVVENRPLEWSRGVIRFNLVFQDDCSSFSSLILASPDTRPPSNLLPAKSRLLPSVPVSATTSLPKVYHFPSFAWISHSALSSWHTFFSLMSILNVAAAVFMLLVRPFCSSISRLKSTMQVGYYSLWYQSIILIGLSPVEFRGWVDLVLLDAAKSSFQYFGWNGRIGSFFDSMNINSVYLGKSSHNQVISSSILTNSLLHIIIYTILLLASTILKRLKHKGLLKCILEARVGFILVFATRICNLSALTVSTVFHSMVFNFSAIISMMVAIFLPLLVLAELLCSLFYGLKYAPSFEINRSILVKSYIPLDLFSPEQQQSSYSVYFIIDVILLCVHAILQAVFGLSPKLGAIAQVLIALSIAGISLFLHPDPPMITLCRHRLFLVVSLFVLGAYLVRRDAPPYIIDILSSVFMAVILTALGFGIAQLLLFAAEVITILKPKLWYSLEITVPSKPTPSTSDQTRVLFPPNLISRPSDPQHPPHSLTHTEPHRSLPNTMDLSTSIPNNKNNTREE
jgi:hypothetical protein